MAYQYPAMVAWNPGTSAVVKATVFQVYAPGDTSFASPLAITDPLGNALANLNSGSLGVFPAFQQAQYATVVVSDVPNHTYAWTVPASQVNPVVPWAANTYYAQNQPAVDPNGNLVTAKIAHTSASTFDATKWAVSTWFSIDGGAAATVFQTAQNLNGGTANG